MTHQHYYSNNSTTGESSVAKSYRLNRSEPMMYVLQLSWFLSSTFYLWFAFIYILFAYLFEQIYLFAYLVKSSSLICIFIEIFTSYLNTHLSLICLYLYMWCDQTKSVWSRSNSVFIFLPNSMHHIYSYILQKTPLKTVNWFQRYEQLKDAKNNRKQKTFSALFGSVLKSIFPTSDWFCLITSHIYILLAFDQYFLFAYLFKSSLTCTFIEIFTT